MYKNIEKMDIEASTVNKNKKIHSDDLMVPCNVAIIFLLV